MILTAQLTMPDEDVTMTVLTKVDGMKGMDLLAKQIERHSAPLLAVNPRN